MNAKRFGSVLVAGLAVCSSGCGEFVRDSGRAPALVIVQSLVGIPGDAPNQDGSGTLVSDVLTLVTSPAPCSTDSPCPTIFNDGGEVTMSLALKDPGQPGSPAEPTPLNSVTFTRYRVEYRRTDGRNVPGVDVPFPIDSALTFTVPPTGTASAGFELVRHTQKQEAPLLALRTNGAIISTIAEVSFFGRDQVGHDVIVRGSLGINFGNVRQ